MMNKRAVRTGLSMLALALSALAASAQLNPTVKVLSTPTTPVPAECIEGTAPQSQPRIDVAQIPEAPRKKPMAAPPSASLRGLLEETQMAAGRGDRVGFRDALTRAKGMLETYPTGGERSVAAELTGIYDDVDRIWSYQLEAPSGAFFDAATASAEIMKRYPGYEKAIAGQVFVDSSGHRYYPSVETREYLLREAAQRLSRLGVSATAPPVRESHITPRTTPTSTAKSAAVTPRATQTPAVHKTTTGAEPTVKTAAKPSKPAAHHATKSVKSPVEKPAAKPAVKTAAATTIVEAPKKTVEAPKKTAEAPKSGSMTAPPAKAAEVPKVAALPTASPTPSTPLVTEPTAPPATTSMPSPTTSPAPTPALPSASTDTSATASLTTPVSTETSASATSTDTTGTQAKQEPRQGKSVILPIILIVVGIGVLIVLFRASS